MPSFSTEVPHQLGKEQATQRLKSFIEMVSQRFKEQVSRMEGSWEDHELNFSLTTYGFNISGQLTVEDDRAHLTGELPLAAAIFKGKIEESIAEELRRELAS
jgi:hypothetical protein